MAKTLAPTKGNLMMAKNTLRLSKQGYEMLDKYGASDIHRKSFLVKYFKAKNAGK